MSATEGKGDFEKLLLSSTVSDLETPMKSSDGEVVVIDASLMPAAGFDVLVQRGILSAPVYDRVTCHYVGFLDLRDMVSFVVFSEKEKERKTHSNVQEIVGCGIKMFRNALQGVTTSYLARRHPFHPVAPTASVAEVSQILATGVHRVPVVDDGKVIDLISQSVVIKFLSKSLAKIGGGGEVLVRDAEIGSAPVLAVKHSDTTLHTFSLLDQQGKSGTAVLDDHGAILTQTSGKDLKLWLRSPSSVLMKIPILEFLKKIRADELDITALAITVSQNATLAHVIGKLHATHSHRVFVIDSRNTPTRVISLTDILRYATHCHH
jgi:CBS-domain-containing membrane protein